MFLTPSVAAGGSATGLSVTGAWLASPLPVIGSAYTFWQGLGHAWYTSQCAEIGLGLLNRRAVASVLTRPRPSTVIDQVCFLLR
jgi:hypothetical protein